ncbi:MAG TPA: methyltransferase domain-containing protein [Sphingomicrobium sp.]|nr:methyltransferase domain-containing protein [Sphingomicrobium sp.]
MPGPLFNSRLRALRRDRAARMGGELVLLDRAFNECLDRLRDLNRDFDRTLLIGSPSPEWPRRLEQAVSRVEVFDPGPRMAAGASGVAGEEDRHDFGEARFDLVIAVGTLDTVNDLPLALRQIQRSLRPDAPLLGAMAGGDTLPALRSAMIQADLATGGVAPRVHPRIEPSSLATLLASAGFIMPVVDVDRVRLRYRLLGDLVRDLRAMAATNILVDRAAGRGHDWARLAATAFANLGKDGRTEERFDILHFLGWTPR